MTRLEKCELLKELGYTYNPDTGEVIGLRGNVIKRKTNAGYVSIGGGYYFKGSLSAHHYAWYMTYGNVDFEMIDHINGNPSDNRISNLRVVTPQENNFNFQKAKGYSWDKSRNKWIATIQLEKKHIYLGRYNTEEEARNAYLQAKLKYHIIS